MLHPRPLCRPRSGFVGRADLNLLLGLCASSPSACTASAGSASLAGATDNSLYSVAASVAAPAAGDSAWVRLALPGAPRALRRVAARGIVGSGTLVTVSLETSSGALYTLGSINATQSYAFVPFAANASWPADGAALRVASAAKFTLQEVGATSEQSFEYAAIDLGAVLPVGAIRCASVPGGRLDRAGPPGGDLQGHAGAGNLRPSAEPPPTSDGNLMPPFPDRTRYWPSSSGLASSLLCGNSSDPASWQQLETLNLSNIQAVLLTWQQTKACRYIAVRHTVRWEAREAAGCGRREAHVVRGSACA
mgnify:CR=1 FL=1